MDNNILSYQDEYLKKLEAELGLEDIIEEFGMTEKQLEQMGFLIPNLPNIDINNFNDLLTELPEFEKDLLPRWKTADIPVMVVVGFLGALISIGLTDVFDELHEKWGGKPFNKGGHGGQESDWVPGNSGPGQFWHRLKHGHDVLNPFEIDWDKFFAGNEDANNMALIKKLLYWLKHLFQDTFSKEGLPLPGSSYFRDTIQKMCEGIAGNAGNDARNVYKQLFTIKARDTVGTAFVAGAMSLYVLGTEQGEKRKFFNYRYSSLTLGSLIINICFGLSLAPENASLNYSSIVATIPYAVTLFKVDQRLKEQIAKRNEIIANNAGVLSSNESELDKTLSAINEYDSRLNEVLQNLELYHTENTELLKSCIDDCNIIISKQEEWITRVEYELDINKEAM